MKAEEPFSSREAENDFVVIVKEATVHMILHTYIHLMSVPFSFCFFFSLTICSGLGGVRSLASTRALLVWALPTQRPPCLNQYQLSCVLPNQPLI